MKLLVIGAALMGSAAAYDMARTPQVATVTLADNDIRRTRQVAARANRITADKKVRATVLDASDEKAAAKLMRGARSCPRYWKASSRVRDTKYASCELRHTNRFERPVCAGYWAGASRDELRPSPWSITTIPRPT
jgi:hypothetical protein